MIRRGPLGAGISNAAIGVRGARWTCRGSASGSSSSMHKLGLFRRDELAVSEKQVPDVFGAKC